jgi:hypothetical protein
MRLMQSPRHDQKIIGTYYPAIRARPPVLLGGLKHKKSSLKRGTSLAEVTSQLVPHITMFSESKLWKLCNPRVNASYSCVCTEHE